MVTQQMAQAETRKRRRKVPWSFLVAGLAIAAAVVYLVMSGTRAFSESYMTVGQVRACSTCATQTVRVAGVVAPNSIERNDKTQVVHFTITDSSGSMPVVYSGVVPDIFRSGVQVVVEGAPANGVFQAHTLLAKCPSKFQAATPAPTGN